MKLVLHNFLLLIASWMVVSSAYGQSLSERLTTEDAVSLATQARKDGNIVRGAILFHQGSINCAKCHLQAAENNRFGPDLSRLGPEATDASIVESILQPSKQIKKGYETISILTVEGEIISGVPVSEDENKIVLRNGQNIEQLITVGREDIQQTMPGTKSNMPDGLANALKDRQQFLDLLLYVLEIKDRGASDGNSPSETAAASSTARRELSDELKGLVLISRLNCVACHEDGTTLSKLAAKQPPNLKWSARRLNPSHLVEFISSPQQVKPGTSMPHMLGPLDESVRKETAEAIVQYLVSMAGSEFGQHDEENSDADAIHQGFDLFHSVGCVACHAPRNELAVEQQRADSSPLGDLTNKYDQRSLTEFLENPHVVRPSGRMPNMQLTHREAMNVSSYLLQAGAPKNRATHRKWTTNESLARKGKRLFAELNCVSCHTSVQKTEAEFAKRPTLVELNPNKGCLSDAMGAWPDFQLTSSGKEQIRSALSSLSTELTAQQQIEATLVAFNCTACHSRDDLGGVTAQRSHHFQTTNLNLGEQGRIPPTLSGVGAKLDAKWMRDVIVNRRSIRPYMKTRMPQYGEENVGHLVELFQTTDQLSDTEFATLTDQKEMRTLGLEIAGNQGLNCVACHTFQYKIADTMPAVDLTEMAQRLKKDWFYQYMLAPQKFSPNTVMPSFWPNGKAIRPDITGEPEDQIEALWQYLLDGRQARAPRGVIREPLEIVVEGEARMLRRKSQGTGKRGISVGYPGGVNLAYDAEQMRLAVIWKGKFIDPSGVWYGQGHGTVRTLGPTLDFPIGPDLDDLSHPWIVDDGRPPNHQFRGYVLDDLRRPILRYKFGPIEINDYFAEFTDVETGRVQLRRRISMKSPERRDCLRFRIAADGDISLASPDVYSIGQRLKVRVKSKHDARLIAGDDESLLIVPLSIKAGQDQELVLEYLW